MVPSGITLVVSRVVIGGFGLRHIGIAVREREGVD